MKNRPLSRVGIFRRHGCAITTLIHYTVKLFAFFPSGKSSSSAKSKYFQAQIRTSLCQQTPQWKNKSKQFQSNEPPKQRQITLHLFQFVFGRHGAFLYTQTTQHINNICYGVVLHFSSRQYCIHASGSKTQNGRSRWIERVKDKKNTISRNAFINMIEIWMQFFSQMEFPSVLFLRLTMLAYYTCMNVHCAGTVVALHSFTSIYRSFQMFELCLF